MGVGTGGPAGIPGGSEYGRRLQQALAGYYRLAPFNAQDPQFVIVHVRLNRNGRVLSIENGRLDPGSMIRKSRHSVINFRVEGALLELDRRQQHVHSCRQEHFDQWRSGLFHQQLPARQCRVGGINSGFQLWRLDLVGKKRQHQHNPKQPILWSGSDSGLRMVWFQAQRLVELDE